MCPYVPLSLLRPALDLMLTMDTMDILNFDRVKDWVFSVHSVVICYGHIVDTMDRITGSVSEGLLVPLR